MLVVGRFCERLPYRVARVLRPKTDILLMVQQQYRALPFRLLVNLDQSDSCSLFLADASTAPLEFLERQTFEQL